MGGADGLVIHRIVLGVVVALLGGVMVAVAVVARGMASAFRGADLGDGFAVFVVVAVAALFIVLMAGIVRPRWRIGLIVGLVAAGGLSTLLIVEIAQSGGDPSLYGPVAVLGWWMAYAIGQLRAVPPPARVERP